MLGVSPASSNQEEFLMRKRYQDRPTKRTISLPTTLSNKVDVYLYDPISNKLKYGAFGDLIASLLRKHFAGLSRETHAVDQSMRRALDGTDISDLRHMLTELTSGTPYIETQRKLLGDLDRIIKELGK